MRKYAAKIAQARRINKRQPLHKLDDDEDEEGEDDDVTSVYSFKTLYNLNVMESEHIRPLWISTTATSQVHKVSVEVDTGAACNVMTVYLFSKIFGNKQPESSNARIQAYGGMPVTIVGKCTVFIHNPVGRQTSAVFQVTHHNGHAIIGRSTSRDIGYVNFPAIDCPPLSMTPITHAVQTLQQHVEKPIVTHKTQSSITIDNITHKLPISKDYVLNRLRAQQDPKKKAYSWWIRLDASPTNILQHILNNRCSDYMRFFRFRVNLKRQN